MPGGSGRGSPRTRLSTLSPANANRSISRSRPLRSGDGARSPSAGPSVPSGAGASSPSRWRSSDIAERPAFSTSLSASAHSSGRAVITSRAALAWTTMRLTLWLTMSCSSLAILARSASTAARAALADSRSSMRPRSSMTAR